MYKQGSVSIGSDKATPGSRGSFWNNILRGLQAGGGAGHGPKWVCTWFAMSEKATRFGRSCTYI